MEKNEAVVAATCKTSKSNIVAAEKKLKQFEKSLSDVSEPNARSNVEIFDLATHL